jgi:heptaprenyl diphosphate synthase
VLGLARHLPSRHFGPVSLSVLAAFGHVGGQLALAGWWLLPGAALITLLPVFAAAALVFGTVNGVIVARLLAGAASSGRQSAACSPPSIP